MPHPLPGLLAEQAVGRGSSHQKSERGLGGVAVQPRKETPGRVREFLQEGLEISPPWYSQVERAGGSSDRNAGCPRSEQRGSAQCRGFSPHCVLLSQESEQNKSTSVLSIYLSSSKGPRSGSPWSPAAQVLQGLARSMENRASCLAVQYGASSCHGNEESSASFITLVMVQSMTA